MSLENNPSKLVIISGPSCGGKTTIIDEFIKINPSFQRIVTDTTRPPRENEKDGVDYNFRSHKDFFKLRKEGHYAETTEYRLGDYKGFPLQYLNNLVNGQSYICTISPDVAGNFCSHLDKLDQSLLDEIKPRIVPVYVGVSNLIKLFRRSQLRQPPVEKTDFINTFMKDYESWNKYKHYFPNLILTDTTADHAVAQLQDIISRN